MSEGAARSPNEPHGEPLEGRLRAAMRKSFVPGNYEFGVKCGKVKAFVQETLGLRAQPFQSDGQLWLSFDAASKQVDPHWNPKTNARDLAAAWDCFVSVACRGDFITCETASVTASNCAYDAPKREEPPRPIAVEWTKQIANACGLTYVAAAPLRLWRVSYDEVDPGFYLDYSEDPPNAFQVLFHE